MLKQMMTPEEIFVFGSNRQGIHGAGAALAARRYHGAVYGVGEGRTGNSYAIPTKATPYRRLPIEEIAVHVYRFLTYAREHHDLKFRVTRVGCGFAGYTDADIAPLFAGAPGNCELPEGWRAVTDTP